MVYVIVLEPAATPVTTPADVMVALAVVAETQGLTAAAVPEPVSVVVPFLQTVNVPEMVGFGFTVTVAVMAQPFVLV